MTCFKLDTFQAQNFKVVFDRIPNTVFLLKTFEVPGIQGGSATQSTPFNNVPLPGDAVQYDYITLQANLSEDWTNYREVHDWIAQINFPQSFEQYQTLDSEQLQPMSDASVMLMNNANRVIREMRFKDCFPVSLSGIPLDVTVARAEPVPFTATFAYSFYQFV